MDVVKWGIVGPGKIAHKFARDIFLVPGARLEAVASSSGERAAGFAGQYNIPYAYGSYEALLDNPGVDVIYIATPHSFHFENTLLFLNQGIPVVCEKPLAINSRQVEKMTEAAKATGTFFMEGMWMRFFPLIEKAMELVKNGEIGEIRTVKADFGFHSAFNPEGRVYNKKLGGGSVLDVGIYPLFLALLFMGQPKRIQASAVWSPTGTDESCSVILDYGSNRMAHLYSSVVTKTEVEAVIYGTEGFINLHSNFHHPSRLSVGKYYQEQQVFHQPYAGNGFQYQIGEVLHCLRDGRKESLKMPHSLSVELMQLLDNVRKEAGIKYPEDKD